MDDKTLRKEAAMKFVRLVNLTDEGVARAEGFGEAFVEARKIMDEHGVRLLHSWVTLGEYDLISVIEAPDEKTALQISALIAGTGKERAKTLPAIPLEEFIESLKEG